jgi:hypothetical protein
MQNVVKLAPLYISLVYSLVSLYFWFLMGKSSWVHSRTQGLFSHLFQVVMYLGYCKNWLAPAIVAECDHGHDPSELSCL